MADLLFCIYSSIVFCTNHFFKFISKDHANNEACR